MNLDQILSNFCFLLAAFFLGSLPTAYIIGKIHGIDIRQHGSGNVGATNIRRVIGKKPAAITLAIDILKGVVAVLLLGCLHIKTLPSGVQSGDIGPFLGLSSILGHCYTPFLGFRGGKGVATSLGVFLVLAFIPTVIAAALFLIIHKVFRYVSLGSICAAIALPIAVYWRLPSYGIETFVMSLAGAALVVYRHKENIVRLLACNETKTT